MTDDRDWRMCAPYAPPPSDMSVRIAAGGPVWLYDTEDGSAWSSQDFDPDDAA